MSISTAELNNLPANITKLSNHCIQMQPVNTAFNSIDYIYSIKVLDHNFEKIWPIWPIKVYASG